MALNDWMAAYPKRTLGEMHLPGSHDAGTAKNYIDLVGTGATVKNSATQDKTITQQLSLGTRFFDLRLTIHNNQVVAHHTTKGTGAYSTITVNTVLTEAAAFCDTNKTEVVVLRISHTSLETDVQKIIKASGGTALNTTPGNLCLKTLEEITADGGLVCILDQAEFANKINPAKGIHSYTKYNGTPTTNGITCCGCFQGSHELHDIITNGLKGQYEHNQKHNPGRHDHLWQVYWQKTYFNPFSSTGIEKGTKKKATFSHRNHKCHGGTHAATDHMIQLMQGHDRRKGEGYTVKSRKLGKNVMYSTQQARNFTLPNIISYDFVNDATNGQIIALNAKGVQQVEDNDPSGEDKNQRQEPYDI